MYCWSCGHKNPDHNKFCGECGKAQVRPPVFVDKDAITDNVKTMNPPAPGQRVDAEPKSSRETKPAIPVVPPPGTGITPTPPARGIDAARHRFASTNPLIGESRVVKDSPSAPPVGVVEPEKPAPTANSEGPSGITSNVTSGVTSESARRSSQASPRISGPSFLGLSDAPETSGSPDYLLDDEAESSSTARSYIALALVLLFGVLIYKQWDTVSAAGRDLMQRATTSAGVPTRQPEIAAKPTKASVYHGLDDAKPESDNPSATEEKAGAEKLAANEAAAAAAKPVAEPKPEDVKAETTGSTTGESKTGESKASEAKTGETAATSASASESASAKGASRSSAREAVPAAAVYDDPQIDLAQKYLQGRGVAQDCNRGVSLLRSAAAQPNPKAQIKLGALYATGHCVTQDRAEAYRWFAEAHQLQPGNQWIDKNLNTLWAEMTPVERGRAQR